MKKFILIPIAVLLYACAASTAPMATPEQSTPTPKPTQTQSSYDRANAAADAAFDEFDDDLNGEAGNSTPDRGSNTPSNTGNSAYDRQQTAADNAFDELDCEIAGVEICSSPAQPAPAPEATQAEPANTPPITEKPRPGGAVAEKSQDRMVTKYPLENGYPIWFSQPSYDGYLGGVGIAKPQRVGGYATQRRVALVQAQADLARSVKVNIYGELSIERLLVDRDVRQYYQEKFSSFSRQQVDLFVGNPQVLDEWIDNRTGELYIWVVIPK